jgi:hypothetical protein
MRVMDMTWILFQGALSVATDAICATLFSDPAIPLEMR